MPVEKPQWLRDSYSLRAHLIAFAIATLLPVTILAGVLLTRSAILEREQLETRLVQVASDLADDIDRDLDRHFTVLQTLAALPVFNVNLPIVRDGDVRYILIFGQRADDLRQVLTSPHLGTDWIRTLLDSKGVVLARSKSHEKFVGTTHPAFAAAITAPDTAVRRAISPKATQCCA